MRRRIIPEASFTVSLSLNGSPHYTVPELTEREMTAVGYVTSQWAFLEHALFIDTIERAAKLKTGIPKDAKNKSFSRRLRAWHSLIQEAKRIRPAAKQKLAKLHSRIANLEAQRHQVTHGLWAWNAKKPHKLISYSFRPEVEFEEPYDFKKIFQLGDRIGAVTFTLIYPGGKAHAYREMARRGSYVSRSALLEMHERASGSLDLPQATLPKRKGPLPS